MDETTDSSERWTRARGPIACVLLPLLPIAAHHPDAVVAGADLADLSSPGRAVHTGRGAAARIRWCDPAARARGVRPAQTLAAARARCATLTSALLDEATMRDARREVIALALRESPRVTVAGPTRLWVEPAPLRGANADAPEAWGTRLAETLRWAGARVGIGAWAAASYAAALVASPCRVLDDSAAFLDRAPLRALELDARLTERLAGLGVRRAGELRRLDPKQLGSRFGVEVTEAWRRAGGDDPRGPVTPSPERTPAVELTFDEIPLDRIEPLLFLLRGAIARLLRAPRGRAEGLSALALSVRLERGAPLELRVRSAQPIADERAWLSLVQAKLERRARDTDRVEHAHALRLEALETGPVRDATADLYGDTGRDPVAREVVLARLAGRFGEDALTRASRAEAAHPLARARWSRETPTAGAALPWRELSPPPLVQGDRVRLAGRARQVLRRGRIERALAPWWTTGALVVERLAWAELEGPLLVLLRQRGERWEAVAWVD